MQKKNEDSYVLIANKLYEKLNPELHGEIIYTEAANGLFAILPAYIVKSGAKVVLATKDNDYCKKEEALSDVKKYFEYFNLDFKDNCSIENDSTLSECTIALNTGNTRPYNTLKLKKMKNLKGISLMWEPWELRENEINTLYLKNNKIKLYGTNERNYLLNTFDYLSLSIIKKITEYGFDIFNDKFLIYGSKIFSKHLIKIFKGLNVDYSWVEFLKKELSIEEYDCIIILQHENKRNLFSNNEMSILEILNKKDMGFVHVCGNISNEDKLLLKKYQSNTWKSFGYMTIDASYFSIKPAIDLLIAGLKVAESIVTQNDEFNLVLDYFKGK